MSCGLSVKDLAADQPDNKPAFTRDKALSKAKQMYLDNHPALQGQTLTYDKGESELVYYIDQGQKARLAYHANFLTEKQNGGSPSRPYMVLDAKNGSVLEQWDGLTTEQVGTGPAGNPKWVNTDMVLIIYLH